jgi:hypothetical protein
MELKPALAEATAGRAENELFKISKGVLATPDTALADYVLAEQAAERLKDGFAEYFQRYDALLCPVLPIPAHAHGLAEFVINGQTVPAKHILSATVPFNVAGLPGLSIVRHEPGRTANRRAVGIQLAGRIDGSAPRLAAGDGKPGSQPSPEDLARKQRWLIRTTAWKPSPNWKHRTSSNGAAEHLFAVCFGFSWSSSIPQP